MEEARLDVDEAFRIAVVYSLLYRKGHSLYNKGPPLIPATGPCRASRRATEALNVMCDISSGRVSRP